MGLSIYTRPDGASAISQDGDFTAPFAITFDGRIGGYKEVKLFVRNDNATRYFSGLTLSLEDNSALNIVTNTSAGFAWKLAYGDTKPTYNDWVNTTAGNTIELPDVGAAGDPDTSTYLPFWLFIQVPEGMDIQLFTDVKFILAGDENLV
jgi:hypothetical protein